MALTRPKVKEILSKANIDDEKMNEAVEAIIAGHTASIDALKEERDNYKADAEKLSKVEKELNDYKEAEKNAEKDPYKVKYEAMKEKYDNLTKEIADKETKAAKITEFKALLKEVGISEKRFDSIVKVTNFDDYELDENKKIKDRDSKKETVKAEWEDFIVTTETKGAKTETPPANNGGNTMTKEKIRAIKDPVERQKAMAENKGLFGLS